MLADREDRWVTGMGAWFPGERVVLRGQDLLHGFHESSWMEVFLYGITGKNFTAEQVRLFDGLWKLCASYPDPRLWNNRVAALAGTVRSTGALAVGAASAVSEATLYGRRPDITAIDFLLQTQRRMEEGADLADLVRKELKGFRKIPGYGRPVTPKDERIDPAMALAERLGLANGTYIRLAFAIEQLLLKGRWRLHMNIAVVTAALAADQGLSAREYYLYTILSFSAGMFPCYLDALQKPEGGFFPMRCNRVQYEGVPRRRW